MRVFTKNSKILTLKKNKRTIAFTDPIPPPPKIIPIKMVCIHEECN